MYTLLGNSNENFNCAKNKIISRLQGKLYLGVQGPTSQV